MNVLPTAEHGEFHCDASSSKGEGTRARLTCQDRLVLHGITQSILVLDQGQWQWNPPSAHCVARLTREEDVCELALHTLPEAIHGEFISDELPP